MYSIFQKAANFIKQIKTPGWLKFLLVRIVRPILEGIGEYVISDIRQGIIVANSHNDWDNTTKFNYVFDRIMGMHKNIGENALGIAIKVTLAELKEKGAIT